jgi:hypothetical protein
VNPFGSLSSLESEPFASISDNHENQLGTDLTFTCLMQVNPNEPFSTLFLEIFFMEKKTLKKVHWVHYRKKSGIFNINILPILLKGGLFAEFSKWMTLGSLRVNPVNPRNRRKDRNAYRSICTSEKAGSTWAIQSQDFID